MTSIVATFGEFEFIRDDSREKLLSNLKRRAVFENRVDDI